MAEPTLQLGGGNWAGKSGNLLGYYEQNKKFYAEDFTFSRSTSGTIINSDGYIQEMPYNLFQYSEDFSQNFWMQNYNGIIPTSTTTAPNGTKTAQKYSETTAPYNLIRPQTNILGTDYTLSVYVKNVDADNFYIRTSSGFSYYNFSNGTTSNTNLTATDVGNGWILLVTSSPSDTFKQFGIGESDTDLTEANNSVYVWGAQLVKGSSAKTYFPTTARLNMPRVDYLNNSNGSLLLEPQRTNELRYGNISNWTTQGITGLLNQGTSPQNRQEATLVSETNSNASHFAYVANSSLTSGSQYTYSGFVKQGTQRYAFFHLVLGSVRYGIIFDFVTKSVTDVHYTGTPINESYHFTEYDNGWFRLVISMQNSGGTAYPVIGLSDSPTPTYNSNAQPIYQGNSSKNIYVWGLQLEQGDYATSYIPTSGSSVTRNADVCSITNASDRINSSEGVLYVETSYVDKGYGSSIAITDGTNSQRVQIYFNNVDLSLLLTVKVNDTIVGTHTVPSSGIDWDSTNKIAIKYKTNDMSFWLNGTKVAEDTSGTMFSANTLTKLGFDSGSGGSFYGKCKQIQVYSTALSDTELAELTTL